MKTDLNDDERPLFESLDEMCEAYGFDDATKEQMRRDMELTAPREMDEQEQGFLRALTRRFNGAARH